MLIANLIIMIGFIGIGIKHFVVKPIQSITDQLSVIQGDQIDLSKKIEIKTNDEFKELVLAFNDMLETLKGVIGVVRDSSNQLTTSTREVSSSTEQVNEASREVSANTNQLAIQAEEGFKSISEVNKELVDLSGLIKNSQKKAVSTHENSQHTFQLASDGKESVDIVIDKMGNIQTKTNETKEHIAILDKYSKEIIGIAQMISEIAEQTNLLALNASIEAARAGEGGKGFAVVADEVRKLAEQSTDRAENVKEIVNKITETSSKTVYLTEESQKEVEEGVKAVNLAGQSLEGILQAVQTVVKDVKDIQDASNENITSSEKIVGLLDSVSEFIEQTAASTEEVSASTQETTASLDTITDRVDEIKKMSVELNTTVHQFKTH
ncbi:chemotaxis protein [Pontibacillus marinus BH030004 = DSM 16465]|uniref:Chemotaxis protein n=1 Tax=Pontibacillus marinus BH030004 = DSM 16465 TaxID=1385511 RepID=A0A0A5G214_9BACI|nr:chemotaxis protein [Pontibacillus marinus BH030004 = DSM 16465]